MNAHTPSASRRLRARAALAELAAELGRAPTQLEFYGATGTAYWQVLDNHTGESWNDVLRSLGLSVNKSGGKVTERSTRPCLNDCGAFPVAGMRYCERCKRSWEWMGENDGAYSVGLRRG